MRTTIICMALCLLSTTAITALGQGTLIWSDEFDGATINSANWSYQLGGGGWGNNEWEYYTASSSNSYVADGYLHIVAREQSIGGYNYTSARMRSAGLQDFKYGRLEARMKLPSTQGIWPAFWMMPTDAVYGGWAASGEIDIMESINTANRVYGTIHYGGSWPDNTSSGGSYAGGIDYSADFHTFAIEWSPDLIRWYVDGLPYHTETSSTWYTNAAPGNPRAPFDERFHFILNVAVGGNWPGYPDGSSVFPQEMVVDWVRVYDLTGQEPYYGSPQTLPGLVEAEDFDTGTENVAYHDCDGGNNGGQYRLDTDVDIEACNEGGYNIGWVCDGEWIEYSVDVLESASYLIETRVSSQNTGGAFRILFDDVDATGTVNVPITGGWQTWTTVTANANLAAGEQIMRFEKVGSSGAEFNVNYFDVYPVGDVDRNHVVDLTDLGALLGVYDTCTGDAGFNPAADFDGSGCIDLTDLGMLLANYGLG